MEKGFLEKLVDSTDKSIDQTIVFTGIGLLTIIICGIIWVCLDAKDFQISGLGVAIGSLLGGGGMHAAGTGIQSGMSKDTP